jgi:group I intron endonuclease
MEGNIYICTNLINGKQNVGQTMREVKERIKEHKNGSNPTSILHKAIKKYGIKNFKWVSFSCPEEDLDWTETFLIKELNTLVPNGYNLDNGGNKQKHRHEMTKQKIGLKAKERFKIKENHPTFGLHRYGKDSPHYGHKHTEEWKKKQSKRMKGKFVGEKNPNYGNHKLAGKNNPAARPVILISPKGEKFELSCYIPFCKEHNLTQSAICGVLQGKRKHHKGWTAKYNK